MIIIYTRNKYDNKTKMMVNFCKEYKLTYKVHDIKEIPLKQDDINFFMMESVDGTLSIVKDELLYKDKKIDVEQLTIKQLLSLLEDNQKYIKLPIVSNHDGKTLYNDEIDNEGIRIFMSKELRKKERRELREFMYI